MTEPVTGNHTPSRRYIAVLAAVAGGILVIGALLKPEKKPAQVTIPEAEKERLQKLTQKKSLEDMTAYFSGIARDVSSHLVWLNEAQRTGVVWDTSGLIVTSALQPFPQQSMTALAAGGTIRVEPVISSMDSWVAAVHAPAGSVPRVAKTAPVSRLQPGTWVVQVSLRKDGGFLFTPGVYSGVVSTVCGEFQYQELATNVPFNRSMLGGGLFDADGNLLAVVLGCGESYVAVTPDSLQAAIEQASAFAGRLLSRYGMRVSALDGQFQEWFRAQAGALVTEIWKGRLADDAGLNPGDVIVGLDGEAVRGPDDLARLALPAVFPSLELRVLRNGTTVRLTLPAKDDGQESAGPGIVLEPPQEGFVIEAVEPGSRAESSGLDPGDRLLEIGGKQLTSFTTARRALSAASGGPTYAIVERGSRRLVLALK